MKKNIIAVSVLGFLAVVLIFGSIKSDYVASIISEDVPQPTYEKSYTSDGLIIPPKSKGIIDFISGRTFWNNQYNDNRIYFSDDKSVIVQFFNNDNAQDKDFGDTVSGSWRVDGKRLCLDIKTIGDVCYRASMEYTKTGVPGYTDNLILESETSMMIKTYDRQAAGNLILDKSFAKNSTTYLKEMDLIRKNLLDPNRKTFQRKTINLAHVNNITRQYLETAFVSVMNAPIAYLHFSEDGSYSGILKGDYEQYSDDIDVLKAKIDRGHWWVINDKYHCYGHSLDAPKIRDRYIFCKMIVEPAVMVEEEDGFITHSTHGFTMRHPMKKFIPKSEFSNFEIFEKP